MMKDKIVFDVSGYAASGMSVAFLTLGCKLNYSESSYMSHRFSDAGYRIVADDALADIYVVNTCSVTEHADKKCRNIIRRVHKLNPDAVVAVTGCYAQLKPDEIMSIEGVDIVLGAGEKGRLFEAVSEYLAEKRSGKVDVRIKSACDIDRVEVIYPAYSSGERTRSFLKIQDGCDYKCTYCTIPLARGRSRNIPIKELVKQAGEIASAGIKEIVLTGVNTGDFGKSTGEDFLDLLKALNDVDGIERYRISSIEPNLLKEETVRWIASGTRFMPHFHIPLQSGSDRILALMKRRYNREMFRSRIEMIRSLMEKGSDSMPVFFGIDLIVGFPGEGEEEFMDSFAFLRDVVKPSFIHVFPYSRRPGTPAAVMKPQVMESVKSVRTEKMSRLSDELHENFVASCRGRKFSVLFEQKTSDGMMGGYTENYIRVERPYDENSIGKIREITL